MPDVRLMEELLVPFPCEMRPVAAVFAGVERCDGDNHERRVEEHEREQRDDEGNAAMANEQNLVPFTSMQSREEAVKKP